MELFKSKLILENWVYHNEKYSEKELKEAMKEVLKWLQFRR
jgi:cytochrome c-type biogenesis protein CcmE